jgi:molybdopterin/thiamine biosynthesis adenylyltransferase
MPREFCVAMSQELNDALCTHLIRADQQEDLAFALWSPSDGGGRRTALINTIVLPEAGDRSVHGNASFNQQYFHRVCELAMREGLGVAFLHSHPFPSWQGMSHDDVVAEQLIAGPVASLTGLPGVGLTVGSDGTWSARFWEHERQREYRREWSTVVRVVGESLQVDFADQLVPPPALRDSLRRTISVWGPAAHADLARLRIGIVGLGSVGALVAEALARMGMTKFAFIDFDLVEAHNLDRLVSATEADIGRPKVAVAERRVQLVATAESVEIQAVPFSLVEEQGYRSALDCDVLFSCVDRPRARHILNHFAHSHLIPVIDGGIAVWSKPGRGFTGVDWQAQTVGPGRPCLECLGTYDQGDVSTEEAGLLDDPSYMNTLPTGHRLKRNENVFPFSANLASLEVMQLVALVTGAAGITDFGVQRYRYNPGVMELLPPRTCKPSCNQDELVGQGDRYFGLCGRDMTAERARGKSNIGHQLYRHDDLVSG